MEVDIPAPEEVIEIHESTLRMWLIRIGQQE
jgi:hypothetical protein